WLAAEHRPPSVDVVRKDGSSERIRKYVVKVEVKLTDDTNAGAALSVHRDLRLDRKLISLACVNATRIDGASRHGARRGCVRDGRLERCLNNRDQPIDEIGQS